MTNDQRALKARIESLEYEVEELKHTVQLIINNGGSPVYGNTEEY